MKETGKNLHMNNRKNYKEKAEYLIEKDYVNNDHAKALAVFFFKDNKCD
jgi:hypothetical protein